MSYLEESNQERKLVNKINCVISNFWWKVEEYFRYRIGQVRKIIDMLPFVTVAKKIICSRNRSRYLQKKYLPKQ